MTWLQCMVASGSAIGAVGWRWSRSSSLLACWGGETAAESLSMQRMDAAWLCAVRANWAMHGWHGHAQKIGMWELWKLVGEAWPWSVKGTVGWTGPYVEAENAGDRFKACKAGVWGRDSSAQGLGAVGAWRDAEARVTCCKCGRMAKVPGPRGKAGDSQQDAGLASVAWAWKPCRLGPAGEERNRPVGVRKAWGVGPCSAWLLAPLGLQSWACMGPEMMACKSGPKSNPNWA